MSDIKNAKYISVGGKVGKVFQYAKGTAIELHYQDDKMQYPERITVWGLGDQVAEGDRVEIHGYYSDQVEEFTKKDGTTGHGVKRSINGPKLAKREQVQPAPVQEGWDSAAAPF